jgi:tetratricopeptide (TPR) repeat protein
MKLQWAQKELDAFNTMPKYDYIVGPEGRNLKPIASIPAADDLFFEGEAFEKKAGPLPLLKDENSLRLALQKYNEVIKQFPTSDKIDDAAYKAGTIYEYFQDYSIALLYYQSAYQWDPDTIYPARFRAARVLDKDLHRNAEALKLYQEAVQTEGRFDKYREWKEFAERRIREMQKLDQQQ